MPDQQRQARAFNRTQLARALGMGLAVWLTGGIRGVRRD